MPIVSQQDFMIAIFELGSLKTKFVVLEMENQRLLLFANAKEIMSICIIVYVLFCLYIGRVFILKDQCLFYSHGLHVNGLFSQVMTRIWLQWLNQYCEINLSCQVRINYATLLALS